MSYHGYRRETINQKAAELLRAYKAEHPERFQLPMDPIALAEYCGLQVLFDSVDDGNPMMQRLAKIIPAKRLIVVDEKAYANNAGQGHFSIGHELGHWQLYLRKEANDTQCPLFTLTDDEAVEAGFYRTRHGMALPSLPNLRQLSQCALEKLAAFFRDFDTQAVERAVNGFAAAILMPPELVHELAESMNIRTAEDAELPLLVRSCAERCEVSAQAMGYRLKELEILYCEVLPDGRQHFSHRNPIERVQLSLL
ncbi:hypothetical protein A3D88_03775 [Candidatus Peribacteria bacterium RIFCSPHIGHO2_02_FULL_52_16]|nr:MAG: hypothetical protein A2706_04590 [Candidatus Peribacteria bacterium RIFCSPHIGHO2_01_FULL_51_35]OGJ61800.1 MAG: hypothetical protein A3D88_03775 [Candidatus Peribacteria bacterium RIFCSPHIGHO2_02_FULL_52_16]